MNVITFMVELRKVKGNFENTIKNTLFRFDFK